MAATYHETPLTLIAADGVRIPGIEARPAGDPCNHILMLHGITTQKHEWGNFFGNLARSFAERGIASLRIDFRGHGDSSEPPTKFSVASQVLDVIAAVDWLLKRSCARRIHLLGCSFGSPPAIFVAAMRTSVVGTLSFVCPVLDYSATFLRPTTEWASKLFTDKTIQQAFAKGTLKMNDTFAIDAKLLIEMQFLKPFDVLRDIHTPTLVIHGQADSMVPFAISKRHTKSLDHVRLLGIPGMDHGFTDQHDETGESEASQSNFNRIKHEVCSHIQRAS